MLRSILYIEHIPSSDPTFLIRKQRMKSLVVIATVESAIRTLFNPIIRDLLSCILVNIYAAKA